MTFPAEFPTLGTPRLRLRPYTPADVRAVQQLAGDPRVADTTARLSHPYPDGAAEAWIATHAENWRRRTELALAVTRLSGELIGSIGLVFSPESGTAELGYWIGAPHWGNGFATEAAAAVADYGFLTLGLQRIEAHHFARNPASGRVMLKIGLRREGERPRAFEKNGKPEDVVFYGATRADWLARRAARPGPK